MSDDTTKVRELAERPENSAFAGVLFYCADEIDRLRGTLAEIGAPELDEGDPVPDEPTFGARYYVGLARAALEGETALGFDIAMQGYPAQLAGRADAYARRNAGFEREREKRRREVEVEMLRTLFRARLGDHLGPQIEAMLDEAYIASNLAVPAHEPFGPLTPKVLAKLGLDADDAAANKTFDLIRDIARKSGA